MPYKTLAIHHFGNECSYSFRHDHLTPNETHTVELESSHIEPDTPELTQNNIENPALPHECEVFGYIPQDEF